MSFLKLSSNRLILFSLFILIAGFSFMLSGCGETIVGDGPAKKVVEPNAGQFAIDFSACFEDDDTALPDPSPKDFSEVCSIGMGQSTRSLEDAEFTVEAQIMPRETDGTIFSRGADPNGLLFFIDDSTPKFAMKKNRLDPYIVDSGHRLVDDEWAHIAAVLVDEKHGDIFNPEHDSCDEGNVGSHTSIAIDSNGFQHVSYYDEDNQDLMYANNTLGFWVTTTVDIGKISGDNNSFVGQHSSIAIDPNDNSVHISYLDTNNQSAAIWTDNLKYAYCAADCINPNWTPVTLFSPDVRGRFTSIVANNGDVHISYTRVYSSSNNADLMYASCPAANSPCTVLGDWSETTIESDPTPFSTFADGSGFNTSIAMTPNGDLHISYLKKNITSVTDEFRYATCTGTCTTPGNWTKTTIDSSIGTIDRGLTSGQSTSIDAHSDNSVSISYYNADTGDLKYANNSSGWVTATVDSIGNVGIFSFLDVDSSDNVHISYFDATNSSLRYAVCTAASDCSVGDNWSMTNVDTVGDVGRFSSIITDPSTPGPIDYAHISYYDMSTVGDLKHASNSTGPLVAEVADPGDENDAANETPHLDIYVNGEYSNCASTNSNFSDPLDERAVVFVEAVGTGGNDDGVCEQPDETCVEIIGDVDGNGVMIGNDDGICTAGEDCLGLEFEDIDEQIGVMQGFWLNFPTSTKNITPSTRLEAVVDEVRFWKVARTETELQQCMGKELSFSGGTCGIDNATILIGYWKFNTGEGTDIVGHSGSAGGGGSKNFCNNTDRVGDDNLTWIGGHDSTDVRDPDGDVTDLIYINPANEVLYVNPDKDTEIDPLGLVKRLDLSDIDCAGPTADLIPWAGSWLNISGFNWLD